AAGFHRQARRLQVALGRLDQLPLLLQSARRPQAERRRLEQAEGTFQLLARLVVVAGLVGLHAFGAELAGRRARLVVHDGRRSSERGRREQGSTERELSAHHEPLGAFAEGHLKQDANPAPGGGQPDRERGLPWLSASAKTEADMRGRKSGSTGVRAGTGLRALGLACAAALGATAPGCLLPELIVDGSGSHS